MGRDLPHLSKLGIGHKSPIIELPLVNPQIKPDICHCLEMFVSPLSFSKAKFQQHISDKAEIPVLPFPCYFSIPMALHFLLVLTGDLNTDPEEAASCITTAPQGSRMICFWRCAFFLLTFSLINAEKEAVWGLRFWGSKIKLAS